MVPKYFGLPHAICSEIKIDQMFENNKIIPKDLFVTKFKQEINFLDYDRLCKSIKLNITTVDGPINMNKEEEPPHFKSYFHEHFGTTTKGSQLFRRILQYDKPDTPIYNIEVWRKKLNTDEICQGEVRNAYKLLQNKYLPRQLLDFKARIVMGKTQFNYTLSKWTKENISPYCQTCITRGINAHADMLHTLYACPRALSIHEYIRKNLTDLQEISPVSVILTTNRCTQQVTNKGKPHKNVNKAHTVCSVYEGTFVKNTALDYIFSLSLMYIMDCHKAHLIATPKDALITVLAELRAYVKTRPNQLISAYLKRNIHFLKPCTIPQVTTGPYTGTFEFIRPHPPSHPESYQSRRAQLLNKSSSQMPV